MLLFIELVEVTTERWKGDVLVHWEGRIRDIRLIETNATQQLVFHQNIVVHQQCLLPMKIFYEK